MLKRIKSCLLFEPLLVLLGDCLEASHSPVIGGPDLGGLGRLAKREIVDREESVAEMMLFQLISVVSTLMMPSLRFSSSGRPL